jgi:hypothetical protein
MLQLEISAVWQGVVLLSSLYFHFFFINLLVIINAYVSQDTVSLTGTRCLNFHADCPFKPH